MSTSLYEATNDLKELNEALEVEVLEQTQECIKGLIEVIEKQVEGKAENIIKVVKNKEAIVTSRKEEIKRLQELNKKDEKEIADLKRYTKECIERAGKKKSRNSTWKLNCKKGATCSEGNRRN